MILENDSICADILYELESLKTICQEFYEFLNPTDNCFYVAIVLYLADSVKPEVHRQKESTLFIRGFFENLSLRIDVLSLNLI